MTKDINETKWDDATLTKLEIFEEYIKNWLQVAINHEKGNEIEIYDLFSGSGSDVNGRKGSPLIILSSVYKINLNNKKIKIFFNDKEKKKINKLKETISKNYPELPQDIELKTTSIDVEDYKIDSANYFKLIFLDQYGIKYINKANEMISEGTDILMFVSSGHIKRFLECESFKKYINCQHITRENFENKSNYETHKIIAEYFKKIFNDKFIAQFSLVKKNTRNINGLIFISTHPKGLEKFLEVAWKIDPDFGQGNININKDPTKDRRSLFFDELAETDNIKYFKEDLFEFIKDYKTNLDIKAFSLERGFLPRHVTKIFNDNKIKLEVNYYGQSKRGWHLGDKGKKTEIRIRNETNEN